MGKLSVRYPAWGADTACTGLARLLQRPPTPWHYKLTMLTTLITLSLATMAVPHETPTPVPSLTSEALPQRSGPSSRIPYTYMELGYSRATLKGLYEGNDVNINMLGFVGALELGPNVHIFAGGGRSITATVANATVEGGQVDNWFAGIGIHQYVTPQLNGFLRVSVAGYALQADNPFINRAGHDTIYTAGVRMFIWNAWEIGATVARADVPSADMIYEFSALYRLTESLGLGMIYNKPEEGDSVSIGARWYF